MPNPRSTPEQWATLAAIVDHGGFAQAAVALHRSQSSISYSVARLHDALGIKLLEVQGRKAQLTAAGAALLKRSRRIVGDLQDLEAHARSLGQGWESELRLVVDAAFPQPLLIGILGELQRACGNTTLSLADAILSGAEEAIVQGYADLVVTTRVPAGFLGDWLADVALIAVAARGHALHDLDRPVAAADLTHHTQVVIRDSGPAQPRDDGWLGAQHRWTVSGLDASLAVVTAGLAYAWLPEHLVAAGIASGALKPLLLQSGAIRKLPLYLVLVRPEAAGPAARAARELFQTHLPTPAGGSAKLRPGMLD